MVSGLNTHLNTHIEGCKVPILPVTVYTEMMFGCNPNSHQLQEGQRMKSIFSLSEQPWLFTFLFMLSWVACNILITIASDLDLSTEKRYTNPTTLGDAVDSHPDDFCRGALCAGFPGKISSLRRLSLRNPPDQSPTVVRLDPAGAILLPDHGAVAGCGRAGLPPDARFTHRLELHPQLIRACERTAPTLNKLAAVIRSQFSKRFSGAA